MKESTNSPVNPTYKLMAPDSVYSRLGMGLNCTHMKAILASNQLLVLCVIFLDRALNVFGIYYLMSVPSTVMALSHIYVISFCYNFNFETSHLSVKC